MKITFLGTGVFDDETYLNTSALLESKVNILLDCGFTAPYQLFRYKKNINFLDAIFITHHHGDHIFGLPALLLSMLMGGRKKPITIIGQKSTKKYIEKICVLAFSPFKEMWKKGLFKFVELKPEFNFKGLKFETVKTKHPLTNYSVKISDGKKSFYYSGDGAAIKSSKKLMQNCDLISHECWNVNKKEEGHFSVKELLEHVKDINYKKLAVIHMANSERKKIPKRKDILAPKPMQSFRL
ncbi:ribonuclease Z [Candidatus Woesearchaeota archaeon]|nr:ribonuclease Z [Candidatus Woesearchaeota archaeon]